MSDLNLFEREHARLDDLLRAHLLDVAGADFVQAQTGFETWLAATQRHIEIEESQLFAAIPQGARWQAKVYTLEHARIVKLAQAYAEKLARVVAQPPQSARGARVATLMLIDAAHTLRHVLEHHHLREEDALAHELPAELQARVWAGGATA
ncbi:hypothetical protein [Sinimarinibacterium sp. NLF-5-8]|uniref:hypothetical protein n=1 Tax=Sinimarinibacterium sp. NLF-5-8 TaxID=2698684 RepID=UPI00137B95A8|nr:hypothetical protein [Sinimarinibacterium sp. NLF-5-8]QHS10682.1 hypothetical protein GT972_11400 [Sinimarinibacterium sp. NLF-5-8]